MSCFFCVGGHDFSVPCDNIFMVQPRDAQENRNKRQGYKATDRGKIKDQPDIHHRQQDVPKQIAKQKSDNGLDAGTIFHSGHQFSRSAIAEKKLWEREELAIELIDDPAIEMITLKIEKIAPEVACHRPY